MLSTVLAERPDIGVGRLPASSTITTPPAEVFGSAVVAISTTHQSSGNARRGLTGGGLVFRTVYPRAA